nr:MAG TPA: hypothetical protein [Crassvirales sp.]
MRNVLNLIYIFTIVKISEMLGTINYNVYIWCQSKCYSITDVLTDSGTYLNRILADDAKDITMKFITLIVVINELRTRISITDGF